MHEYDFSNRIKDVPRSFIREILKVTQDKSIISFAGGLPSSDFFPVDEMQKASERVFAQYGASVLQYSATEGDTTLRQFIADRYRATQGLDVPIERILITNGSQQAFDLLGKVLLNEGDDVAIEAPGYLGAIQSFSLFQPTFHSVELTDEGLNTDQLSALYAGGVKPKLLYTVSNFQNPSGVSYSSENKRAVVDVLRDERTFLVDDDPYGALRFEGEPSTPFYQLLPEQTVLLGSFSKVVVPGLRLGWMVAPEALMDKLLIAKQAADLHTSSFAQRLIVEYLRENNLDDHIARIVDRYRKQGEAMLSSIARYFPRGVCYTKPQGGMFLWVTLPEGLDAMELFHLAVKDKVAFVPGAPFFVEEGHQNTLRLSFSCVDESTIEEGIKRLGRCMRTLLMAN